jgi:hypothetical protein
MNAKNEFFADDLSDLLGNGDPIVSTPRQLPQDEAFARIRQSGTGLVPAAKAFEVTCQACGGSGVWRGTYKTGPCFKCAGKGKLSRKTAPAVLERAQERRQEAKEAVRQEAAPQIAWLQSKLAQNGLPEGYGKMLGDFLARLQNGQPLSDGQLAVIAKGQARDAEYAAKRQGAAQERAQAAPSVDASKIIEAFQRGAQAGVKHLKLRFQGFTIVQARAFDGLLVKTGPLNIGKVEGGKFVAFRACTPEQAAAVLLVLADPAAAANAYGLQTGSCCVCGRELTNAESVQGGIGPICGRRLGWTPGGLIAKAGVDF